MDDSDEILIASDEGESETIRYESEINGVKHPRVSVHASLRGGAYLYFENSAPMYVPGGLNQHNGEYITSMVNNILKAPLEELLEASGPRHLLLRYRPGNITLSPEGASFDDTMLAVCGLALEVRIKYG